VLDVVFLNAEDPALRRIAAVGHVFEIAPLVMPETPMAPRAPGSDPDRPPRLR
jgi:hypothetical protein